MRAGDEVFLSDGRGGVRKDTVTAVVGSGASGYKLLNFEKLTAVPHEEDAKAGGPFWSLAAPDATPKRTATSGTARTKRVGATFVGKGERTHPEQETQE